jgi:hypothetical protein
MPLPLANPSAQIQTAACRETEGRRLSLLYEAPRSLRLWHLASLDAPSVAVVWSLAFAQTANVHLPAWCPLLLALATWSVYIGDRLLDAHSAIRAGDIACLRERHYFHWHYRHALAPLAIVAAVAAGIIMLALMPFAILERDSALAFAASVYFSGVHLSRGHSTRRLRIVSKEFLVGFLFTAGCALPTVCRLGEMRTFTEKRWPVVIGMAFFALLAWLNCHAIERWESGGLSHISRKTGAIAIAGVFFAIMLHHAAFAVSALLVAGSSAALLLWLLDYFRNRMTALTLRMAADLVLLTPILLVAR